VSGDADCSIYKDNHLPYQQDLVNVQTAQWTNTYSKNKKILVQAGYVYDPCVKGYADEGMNSVR